MMKSQLGCHAIFVSTLQSGSAGQGWCVFGFGSAFFLLVATRTSRLCRLKVE
jgi:hypothetical protein